MVFHDAAGNVVGEADQQILINNTAAWYSGTITNNETWTSNQVNVVYGTVTVAAGVTLTIQPGAVVKFAPGAGLQIVLQNGATLNAPATQTSPIVFTSLADDTVGGDTNLDGDKSTPEPGDWDGLVVALGATVNLSQYVDLRYLNQTCSGTLSSSETLLGTEVYVVTSTVVVPNGVTLNILPGAIVKFDAGQGITVNPGGQLVADGTVAQPIIFTSINDDANGGDTNGDGSATQPAAGDWNQITVSGTAAFDHTEVLYGGSGLNGAIDGGGLITFSDGVMSQSLSEGFNPAGTLNITNSVVTETDRGINCLGGVTNVVNSTFDNNAFGILGHGGEVNATNCIISNSLRAGVANPITIAYCDVWTTAAGAVNYRGMPDPTGTNGDISADPNYVDAAIGNYRLNFGSPCIDAGNGMVGPPTDIMGDPRYNDPRTKNPTGVRDPNGNYADMGAYNFVESATSNLDITVTSVNGPAAATAGGQVTIEWTDANVGTGTIIGPWHDSIYLVNTAGRYQAELLVGNPLPSQNLILVGQVLVGQGVILGPGESYTASATINVPGDAAGPHYWAVECNSAGDIFVGQNTANTTLVSPAPVALSVPALPIDGGTVSGQFSGVGDAQWFEFTPQAGQDILVSLDMADTTGAGELYIGQGYMPSPLDYDEMETQWNSPNVSALAANTSALPYYVLVEASSLSGATSAFTIQASSLDFQLTSASPSKVGNAGPVTLELQGGKLTSDMTYQVVDPTGTAHTATSVYEVSSAVVYATFDLTGLPTGAYSVQVVSQGATKTLDDAITVVQATPVQAQAATQSQPVQVTITGPSYARVGSIVTLNVEYANTSLNDEPAPLLFLYSAAGEFRLPGQTTWTPNSFAVLGISQVGPAGTLQPGYQGDIQVQFMGLPPSVSSSTYSVGLVIPTDAADWPGLEASLDPAFIPTNSWNAIYQNLMGMVGTTWGQYQAALDQDATYLGQIGQPTDQVDQLFNFEVQQAIGYSPLASLATATDAQVATPGQLSLSFSRTFGATILDRNRFGRFGWGWDDSWDTYFSVESDGAVDVYEPGGAIRQFQPNGSGGYTDEPGDFGTLAALSGGGFTLTEVDGLVTAYNPNGSLNYVQDTDGNRITASWTGSLLTSLTASSGQSLTLTYNSAGLVSSITDSTGRTTTYSYDPSNQYLVSVTDFNGQTTGYSYDTTSGSQALNSLTTITYPGNTHQYYTYDGEGRLASSYADGGTQPLTYTYSLGMVSATDIHGDISSYYYNAQGLLTKYVDPLGNVTLAAYDSNLNLTKITDALGQSESYGYNSVGEVTSWTDFLGNTTSFAYSGPFNELASMTDANGNTTKYSYDSSGDMLSTTYANGTSESFTYDPEGDATSFIDPDGQPINVTYNAGGQITGATFSDGSQYTYTYDSQGNLLTATDPTTGTVTFTYDPVTENLTKVAYPNGTWLAFTYNAAGQRTQMVDQTGFTTNYIYNSAGWLTGLTDASGNPIVTYDYCICGRLMKTVNGNGTYTTYTYDADDRITDLTNYAPGGTVNSSFAYTYNAVGLETSETTLDGTWTYSYDADGQLTGAVFASNNPATVPNQDLSYSYDAMGNRTVTVVNGVTTTYIANNVNQYTSVGGVTYKYDANGNLLFDGTNTYTYNSLNELTSVSGPSGTTSYTYNSLGQLVSSTTGGKTTQYLIDPAGLGNVVGTYSGNGNVTGANLIADYTYGLGLTSQVTASNTYYYDFDALGSTVGMTNAGGSYVNSYSYLPFGGTLAETQTVANPFQFVGQYGVTTGIGGLVTMGFRTYATNVGRFTSQDPLGLLGGQIDFYCYVGNSPTGAVDPTGLQDPFDEECDRRIARADQVSEVALGATAFLAFLTSPVPAASFGAIAYGAHLGKIAVEKTKKEYDRRKEALVVLAAMYVVQQQTDDNTYATDGASGGTCPVPGQPAPPISLPRGWEPRPVPSLPANWGTIIWTFSWDPNAIVGPSTYGSDDFVSASSVLPYTIDFENSSTATASCGEIQITQQLDPNLDWSTFQLGDIELGNLDISIPGGMSDINETLDERSTLGVYIQVVAGLNANKGVVTWTLTALDPTTLQIPEDPLLGLLPPDLLPPEGDGSVSYTVRPKASDTTGTIINAQASIVFDTNPPILTRPIISDTLDAGPPTSSINPLPAIETSATFTVSWTGQDDPGGSGIAAYTVFVSDNGGSPQPWPAETDTTDTSATYTGQNGHTYAFTVTAIDNVGNQQLVPSPAVSTTVDTTPPVVSAMLVENGLTERSYVDQLTFQFNEPVTSTAGVPMTLTEFDTAGNLVGPVALTASQFQWTTVPGTGASVLTWSLESFAGGTGSLPNGYYQLTLPSSQIADQYGTPLNGGTDYSANFFVLQGDVNGDGVVDSNDMAIVNAALGSRAGSSNWNPNADLNREDRVVTSDRIIVYDNLGHSITPPAGSQVLPAAVSLPAWSFDGSTQLTTTNDLPTGCPVAGITFNADAGAYVLNGNAAELAGNITNQSPSTQTIDLPLTVIGGSRTIDTGSGDVTIAGNIGQSGGGFGITKTGSGTLVLSGANTYGGGTTVLAGVLQVNSANALPDGGSLTVGAGGVFVFGGSSIAATEASASSLAVAGAQLSKPAVSICPTFICGAAVPAALAGETPAPQVALGQTLPPALGASPPAAAVGGQKSGEHGRQSRPIANHAHAYDAALRSLNTRPSVAEAETAALWDGDTTWSGGQTDGKHDSVNSAVDAVMAMLERMYRR